jgi:hypothetical protein
VTSGPDADIETFFDGRPEALALFACVRGVIESLGPASLRITKSQIAFRRRRAFAWAWTPDRYLRGELPPLVLSVALGRCDPSPRWKEVVEPRPGTWVHHLEIRDAGAIDDEVVRWLAEAAEDAR